jgi:hypothetical protein
MKVYAVFDGEYSDRSLAGVFSTKAEAEAFAGSKLQYTFLDNNGYLHKDEFTDIEEVELDDWGERPRREPHAFILDHRIRNGGNSIAETPLSDEQKEWLRQHPEAIGKADNMDFPRA